MRRARPGGGRADAGGSLRGQEWRWRAACAQSDPEIFFPGLGGPNLAAKLVCRACPVRRECLADALTRGERFGVWGGLSETERRWQRRRVEVTTA